MGPITDSKIFIVHKKSIKKSREFKSLINIEFNKEQVKPREITVTKCHKLKALKNLLD